MMRLRHDERRACGAATRGRPFAMRKVGTVTSTAQARRMRRGNRASARASTAAGTMRTRIRAPHRDEPSLAAHASSGDTGWADALREASAWAAGVHDNGALEKPHSRRSGKRRVPTIVPCRGKAAASHCPNRGVVLHSGPRRGARARRRVRNGARRRSMGEYPVMRRSTVPICRRASSNAREHGVYRSPGGGVGRNVRGERIASGRSDHAICCGVFIGGHTKAGALDAL